MNKDNNNKSNMGNKTNLENNEGSSLSYGAFSIKNEEGAAKHRKRVARFLGSSGVKGLENQLMEQVDNAVDEMAECQVPGKAPDISKKNYINLTIKEDWEVIVEDFGRGIPCENHPSTGESALYLLCESDSAGGKGRGTEGYSSGTAGVHGAGLAVSKSCTEYFRLEVNCLSANGKYLLEYERGERVDEIKRVGDLDKDEEGLFITGTKITYKYDPEIFSLTHDGKTVNQPYFKHMIIQRIKYMLLGSKNDIEVRFKFLNDELMILSPKTYTPEMFLKDHEPVVLSIADPTSKDNSYSADIFLSLMRNRNDGEIKTVVNRLDTKTSTSNDAIIEVVLNMLNELISRDSTLDDKYKGSRFNRTLLRSKLSSLIILTLAGAEFAGQTKSDMVSHKFITDFSIKLEASIRKSKEFIQKIYFPAREAIIQEKMMEVEKKKVEEKIRKMREAQEEKKQDDKLISQLKTDALARAKHRDESRITIKDSPFPKNQSTLVYVEGKSAGAEFNDLHLGGELPLAVALIEGKMPNVIGKEKMSKITIDNRVYCLEAGYKDIGILVDGDVDGNHIRILLCYQIWAYARHYLREGKVYIIPAPYSKVRVNKPMALTLYGEVKAYPVGDVYTYSAKEHQSLMAAGAIFRRKYKGLADSELSPSEALKDRSNWIRIKPVIEEDIILIEKVLEEKSDFKSIFMAEVFSERQFYSKKVSNGKREIELNSKEISKLLNGNFLSEKPEMMNYSDMIDRTYLNRFNVF